MIKIRRSVFETNSSMTHSLVLMNDEQYEAWQCNTLYIHRWYGTDETMTYDEIVKALKADGCYIDHLDKDEIDELALHNLDMVCLESWLNDTSWFEHFNEHHVINNQSVHAFGYYGHN